MMKKTFKIVSRVVIVLIAFGVVLAYNYYQKIYKSNVRQKTYLYVKTGSQYADVVSQLKELKVLDDVSSFEWVASRKEYAEKVKPGKYLMKQGMSNNDLINMLRAGKQEPVNLVFNNIRTNDQLAGKLAKQIEADSASLSNIFKDNNYLKKMGVNSAEVRMLFVPNTYQIWWNTSPEQLMERMMKEYLKFWTPQRDQKAEDANLTRRDVSIIASIVEEETNKNDEKPVIASVYINRLHKGMLLQADPTVKYAVGDFALKRILNVHTSTVSPYNTYMFKGLPPGPICIPSITTIDAVLNYKKTDYIYFCAKEDFSGYHNFARNESEHAANASKYHKAMNARKIY